MDLEQFLLVERNRRDAYQLLASYYALPGDSHLENLPLLAKLLAELSPEAQKLITQSGDLPDLEQLTVDYSQLFIGPYKTLAPPYGSIYLESGRQVMGKSTADVVFRYEKEGIQISNEFKDAPDHISAELEFMYFLIHQEINALEIAETDNAARYIDKQKSFLSVHLSTWIGQFTQAVEEHANTNFYKLVTNATRLFVRQDLNSLQDKNIPEPV